jgi:Homeodomain-like domain
MPAKRYKVHLFPEERDILQRLVSKGKAAAYKRRRAQILLKADQSPQGPAWTDAQICEAFDVGQLTVSRTRKAFVFEGVEATLQRKQRQHPPVPRTLDGAGEAQLIALACSKPPAGYAKWTMQLYADQLVELQVVDSISDETVRRTLKKRPSNLG